MGNTEKLNFSLLKITEKLKSEIKNHEFSLDFYYIFFQNQPLGSANRLLNEYDIMGVS
jgi:hypothetical protein